MKYLLVLTLLALAGGQLHAAELRSVGVLGNSGEQGVTLVRFGLPQVAGIGVACDSEGTLWDRGGDGVLNRYSPDGRQLATYPLPAAGSNHGESDVITLAGDILLLKVADELYTLALSASPGTRPTPLGIRANRLSLSTHEGWAAAVNDKDVFLVNTAGRTKHLGEIEPSQHPYQVEITPNDDVYVDVGQGNSVKFAADGKIEAVTGATAGARFRRIDDHWFGSEWHGTIRRLDSNFHPAPGVVLGGNSGSFIGYVDERGEINEPRGVTKMAPRLFAASGWRGALHLLEWQPAENRMHVLRRIGAIPEVNALGLDRQGRVWFNAGNWEWSDGPATPLRPGMQYPDAVFASVMTDDDRVVAFGRLWQRPTFWAGTMDTHEGSNQPTLSVNRLNDKNGTQLSDDTIALALTDFRGRRAVLALSPDGRCQAAFVAHDGGYIEDAGEVRLRVSTPVKAWTSLVASDDNLLIGAADGWVIELERDKEDWKETRRWKAAGTRFGEKFGDRIHLALDGDTLWISDTFRHRVVCLDRPSRRFIAAFGTVDKPGDVLNTLDTPAFIVARAGRGVVFDSANQRLMKLELTLP